MSNPTITATNGRVFPTFACAVLAIVIDADERVLLLRTPDDHAWQVVDGGLEADETILDGVLRETAEEAGPDVRVRPLGAVHACTWRYDDALTHMVDLIYLLAYEGGASPATT